MSAEGLRPPPHRLIVAGGFRLIGALVGVAGLIVAVGALVVAGVFGHRATAEGEPYLDVTTYGLAGLIANGGHGLADGLTFLAGIASWILVGVAILAFLHALAGLALYLIGRGLRRGMTWARVLGLLVVVVLVLGALPGLAILPPRFAILDAVQIAALLYAGWALGWKFA